MLNLVFLVFASGLVWRFVRSGGLPMLRAMHQPMHDHGSAGVG